MQVNPKYFAITGVGRLSYGGKPPPPAAAVGASAAAAAADPAPNGSAAAFADPNGSAAAAVRLALDCDGAAPIGIPIPEQVRGGPVPGRVRGRPVPERVRGVWESGQPVPEKVRGGPGKLVPELVRGGQPVQEQVRGEKLGRKEGFLRAARKANRSIVFESVRVQACLYDPISQMTI